MFVSNWSGFNRKAIADKTRELEMREKLLAKVAQEQELDEWAVDLIRRSRSQRHAELRRKGLL